MWKKSGSQFLNYKMLLITLIAACCPLLAMAKPLVVFQYSDSGSMLTGSNYWYDIGYNGFCGNPMVQWYDSTTTIQGYTSSWQKANTSLSLAGMNMTLAKKALTYADYSKSPAANLPDWFDDSDWNTITQNFTDTGAFIAAINGAGIMLDPEVYATSGAMGKYIWSMSTHRALTSPAFTSHGPGTLGDGRYWIYYVNAAVGSEMEIVFYDGTNRYVWTNAVSGTQKSVYLDNSRIVNPPLYFSYSGPGTLADGVYWLTHVADNTEYYQLPAGSTVDIYYNDGSIHYEWRTTITSSGRQLRLSNGVLKSGSATPSSAWYDQLHPRAYFSLINVNGGTTPPSAWYDTTQNSSYFTITYTEKQLQKKVYDRAYNATTALLQEDNNASVWCIWACYFCQSDLGRAFIAGLIDASRNYSGSKVVLGVESLYFSKQGYTTWAAACDYIEGMMMQNMVGQKFDGTHTVARSDYSLSFGTSPIQKTGTGADDWTYLLTAADFAEQLAAFEVASDDYIWMYNGGEYGFLDQTGQEFFNAANVSGGMFQFTASAPGGSSTYEITGVSPDVSAQVRAVYDDRAQELYLGYSAPGTLYDGRYWLIHVADNASYPKLNAGESVRVIFNDGAHVYEWINIITASSAQVLLDNSHLTANSATPAVSWYDSTYANSNFTIYGNNQLQWLTATDTLNDKVVLNAAGEYGNAPPSGFYANEHNDGFFKIYRSVSMSGSSAGTLGDGIYWLSYVGSTEGYASGDAVHVIYDDGTSHFEWDTAIGTSPNQVSLSNAVLKTGSATPSSAWYDASHVNNYFWIHKYFKNSDYINAMISEFRN